MPASLSFVKRSLVFGVITSVLALGALMPLVHADTNTRDCDDNAVLKCGTYTTSEVNEKFDASPSAATIYHHFNISSIDVNNLGSTAKNGYVTPGGRVMIGDETVATNATTAGRQNISGSQTVTANGTTFYTRSTDISLNNGKLEAYVVMKDGKFDFAIIKACGNPVTATPKTPEPAPTPAPAPTPQPTPTPTPAPAPAPAPAPVCSNTGQESVGGNCNGAGSICGGAAAAGNGNIAVGGNDNCNNTCVGTNVCNTASPTSSGQCVRLGFATSDNRTVTATVTGSASNATISGYNIDFGDGSPLYAAPVKNSGSANITTAAATTGSTTTNSSTSEAIKHQYAKDGNYMITGYVSVTYADGHTDTNVSSATCKNSVSYNTPVTPVATPPASTPVTPAAAPVAQTLPNTGMSVTQTILLAIVIGIASSIGYGYFLSLRLKKVPVRS